MSDPGNPYERSDWRRLAQFVLVAVLIHMALYPFAGLLLPTPEPFDPNKAQPRRIRLVSGKSLPTKPKEIELPKSEPLPEPEAKEKKEEQKDKLDPDDLNKQVVDVPPMADATAPDEADFLSENNTKVDRQTVSRFRQAPAGAVTNEVTRSAERGLEAPSESSSVNVGPPQEQQKAEKAEKKSILELPERAAKDRLALKLDPEGRFRNERGQDRLLDDGQRFRLSLDGNEKAEKDGRDASAPKRATANNLIPSIGVMAQIAGAPMNDHIEGVDEGDGTFLNTKEFRFASFFNRMKRGIAQHWHPQSEYRRRDPSGNIYGVRTRTTVLQVTLNQDGALEDVEVERSSGLDFLDQVAISAMRSAQPFPNPPKGMVNEDGRITFGFGFTLDFNGRVRLPF